MNPMRTVGAAVAGAAAFLPGMARAGGMSEGFDDRVFLAGVSAANSVGIHNDLAIAGLAFGIPAACTLALLVAMRRWGTAQQASSGIKSS